jgi:hypothetical protein
MLEGLTPGINGGNRSGEGVTAAAVVVDDSDSEYSGTNRGLDAYGGGGGGGRGIAVGTSNVSKYYIGQQVSGMGDGSIGGFIVEIIPDDPYVNGGSGELIIGPSAAGGARGGGGGAGEAGRRGGGILRTSCMRSSSRTPCTKLHRASSSRSSNT